LLKNDTFIGVPTPAQQILPSAELQKEVTMNNLLFLRLLLWLILPAVTIVLFSCIWRLRPKKLFVPLAAAMACAYCAHVTGIISWPVLTVLVAFVWLAGYVGTRSPGHQHRTRMVVLAAIFFSVCFLRVCGKIDDGRSCLLMAAGTLLLAVHTFLSARDESRRTKEGSKGFE
jgi:hypothetical protein